MRIDKGTARDLLVSENRSIDEQLSLNSAQVHKLTAVLSDERCSSDAYSAIAERVRGLRIPVAKAQFLALEAVRAGNEQNLAAIDALPETSPGILDTDTCQAMIDEVMLQNQRLYAQQESCQKGGLGESGSGALFTLYSSMLSMNDAIVSRMNAMVDAAYTYEAASAAYYSAAQDSASSALRGATESVSSYLTLGTFGDTSWVAGAQEGYDKACVRQVERVMLGLSKDGTMYLSPDFQHIYYNGKKWKIDSFLEEVDEYDKKPRISQSWGDPLHTVKMPFSVFNLAEFLAYFGNGTSNPNATQEKSKGTQLSSKNGSTMAGLAIGAEVVGTAASSKHDYEIAFKFFDNGIGGYRVSILGKEEYPTGARSLSTTYWKPGAHMIAAEMYEKYSGKSSFIETRYDISIEYDADRQAEGAYTSSFCFNDSGELVEKVIRYPKDRIVINVDAGLTESIDITDAVFANATGSPDKGFQDAINGKMA